MENRNLNSHLSAKIRKAANQHLEEKYYWLDKLSGDPVKSSFPRDDQGHLDEKSTKTVTFKLSSAVFSKLSQLDKGNDYILYVYMAASLVVLLATYTGNTDIIISTPIYRQDTREVLINTILTLRNQIIPGMTYKQLLRQVRDTITEAEQNQNYPIELAAEHLNLLSGSGDDFPLFDTAVLVESIHDPAYIRGIHHNIIFSFRREETYIKGTVDYNPGSYRQSTVQRITSQFQQLLEDALGNLDIGVSDIDILPTPEKQQLLVEFNNTAVEYPADKTLHGLFEEQVERTPDNTAVVGLLQMKYRTYMTYMTYISYRELNQKSDRLAHLLRDKGVRPDTIVGIMVDRSVEMLIGLLGILKAGGAYLPIDPEYPQERIAYMLKDSEANFLVSMVSGVNGDIEVSSSPWNSPLERGASSIGNIGGGGVYLNLQAAAKPANLAYVIYTSGTTGRPKGVMIEHRPVLNFIQGMTDVINFRPNDRILSLTTICFDIFGLETFVPLTQGSTVLIGTREQQLDPAAAAQVIERERVTIFQVTPSRLQLFLSLREAAKCVVSLRYLLVGGEAFPGPVLAEARTLVREKILNLYGPTETTIWSAVKDLSGEVPLDIGKPIANTQIYVLDSRLKLVPIGVVGEIYIGGHGVARGYLNNPELTAQKFIEPAMGFHRSYMSHMSYIYRTGDLGRWLKDGNLEFLGRIDHQVKIRGYRIELGEIKNRLLKHESVKEAVVIDKVDAANDKYLCAYYVLNSPGSDGPGIDELREYLTRGLPGYMVPSYFIRLEEIPLTFSGKIDRGALPVPEGKPGKEFTAPRDEIEEKLAATWAAVLGEVEHADIGIDDNFFHIGGHSLNAIILISKLYRAFDVNIPPGELFKTPTIRGLSGYIRQAGTTAFVPVVPVEKREYYPLSSAQKRLYFLDRAYEGNIHYNMTVVLMLEAKINREKLEQTFRSLIRRHESFRTSFEMVEEKPVQRIHEKNYKFQITNYKQNTNHKLQITNIIKNFIRPFDLSKAPLLRMGLVELDEDEYIFLMDMHHIISDGVSQALFIKEFTALYTGDTNEDRERPPLQYKDYTCWQESDKEKERIKKQETYWKSEFAGEIPVLELPYDYPRPDIQSFAGETMGFLLEEKETGALGQLAREAQATQFMVIFSIFNILLSKLSGQEDIVAGTPVAARRHPDIQHITGLFINTLPLRNYLPGEKPFRKFLEEVKNRSLKALENQEYPFVELVDLVVKERDQARNPVFDVLFTLQNIDIPEIEIPGLTLSPFPFKNNISKFDLALNTIEIGEKLSFNLEYCTKLFRAQTIERWITYFKRIVCIVIEDPFIRLDDIEIITGEEKARVLFEFNDTRAAYPADKTIHQLFRDQAERTPDNIAVVGPLELKYRSHVTYMTYISYRQLNEKSHHLAYLLHERGVGPDSIVGIMAERSLEMIMGILSILKAGGAYLPIDPEYPQERIDYMLADSNAKILLTRREIANSFGIWNLEFGISPRQGGQLAYIIYTSGSTARPKGVMVRHQNVIRLVKNPNYINLYQPQRLLMTGSLVFDITTFEIWGSLLNGLSLYLVDKETIMDVKRLEETVVKNNISVLHLIPQLFSQVWEHSPGTFAGLEHFLVGGDLVRPGPVNRLRNTYPHLKILHCYGPTENTTFSTTLPVDKTYDVRLPIGKPINNSSVYILDKDGHLTPIGVTGELCFGGDGAARGYLNNPELTAKRFCLRRPGGALFEKTAPVKHLDSPRKNFLLNMSDKNHMLSCNHAAMPPCNHAAMQLSPYHSPQYPITPLPHYPIYHTGDLGRWLPDGNIEFLGRVDHQVKIRGHRIELAEIESWLLIHQDIKEAVVIAKQYLCAYIVSHRHIDRDELREYLSHQLPGYMVPDFFVQLDKILLTPNGKVDRKALPEPGTGEILQAYEAPGKDIEKKLVEVWSQVLGEMEYREIGINDNFFQLGGDSIKAIQVSSRLRKYGLDLKINDLFSHPVIKELAKCVKKIQREIDQGTVEGEVPLTPVQRYFFQFESNPGHYHHFNQAVMLYRQRGFDEGKLTQIFTRLVQHHDALRMVFKFNREKHKIHEKVVQKCRGPEGKLFDLKVFNFGKKDKEIQKEIETEANLIQANIDLGKGPLVKLGLFKTPGGDHLLIVVHHLVMDGISWRILLEDISTGYRQLEQEKEIQFPEKTDSFKHWAEKLTEYASCIRNKSRELQYWQSVESKGAKAGHLPRDHDPPHEKKKTKYLESAALTLNREETRSLLAKVNRAYNTEINDILLTALGMAVNQWAGAEKVLVEMEGHGRESIIEDININRTVGWFTGRYPIILDMNRPGDISYTIRCIKETLRRVPNKGIGYDILKYLTPSEKKKGLTFVLEPEISFNYLGQFGQWGEEEGRGFSRISTGKSTSPETKQTHTLNINGMVTGGKLILSFSYNTYEYDKPTIRALVDNTKSNLLRIIRHCTQDIQNREPVLTPSDVMDIQYLDISLEEFLRITNYIKSNIPGNPAIQAIYSLSPMQKGMLYHALTDQTEDVYFNQYVMQLEGAVENTLLEASFNKLIERYDIFRTIFLYEGLEEPLQVVLKHRKARVHYEDITGLKEEQTLYLEEYRKRDKTRGFDLSKDMLMRLRLFRIDANSYRLLWSQHHILMDGWCMGIIYNELTRFYEGLTKAQPVELGDVTPYGNYIAWLERQDKSAGLHYWEKYLEGYEQQAGLPVPGQGKPVQEKGYKIKDYLLEISEEEMGSLNRLAVRCRVTINTVFQSLWGILLQKYNNSDDAVFGAVVSGRPAEIEGIENMVGLFINTVPVRIKTHPDLEFAGLLRNLRESSTSSRFYEYLPLPEIQAKSRLKGNLIDQIMVFENYPFHEQDTAPDFKVKHIEIYEQSNYHFNVIIVPARPPNPFRIKFSYNALVYKEDTVRRVGRHLKEILRQVTEEPGIMIKVIEMITREEKNRLLFDFNQTSTAYPRDKTIQQLFAEQVQGSPGHTALVGSKSYIPEGQKKRTGKNYHDIHLTYRELNENAGRLAAVLVEKGILPDMTVGIMLPPSVDMIVGILGILKSGAAYLPIDPGYPQERIDFMLKDSGANILVTVPGLSKKFEKLLIVNCQLLIVNEKPPNRRRLNNPPKEANSINNYQLTIYNLQLKSTNLAYIIYTSGSTGKPKGGMIEHKSLINLCYWHNREFSVTVKDRATKYAGPGFDASVWEIFPYLIAGASIYIVPPHLKSDLGQLNNYFEKHHITTAFLPTQACEQFMMMENRSLRVLLTGGDKLKFFAKQRYCLVNNYGPTENTVVATSYPVTAPNSNIPIGKPVDNNKIYILDRHNHLQPIGVPGELCIRGDSLARGYLNNPELTIEKFDQDFWDYQDYQDENNQKFLRGGSGGAVFTKRVPPGRRRQTIYRTGDLACWQPDGNIEFLGRNDQQVKIRGFRIEPGEIENRLLMNEKIKEAAVLARETPTGDKYLCAYIFSENELEPRELKTYLSKDLPAYMIPSYFIRLDKIPLTSNGKINKNALPAPEIKGGGNYIAPGNKVEEQLEEIWCQLLGTEKGVIGIDCDFFQVGGHSLKAATMAAKIYETFNVSISLTEIFETPTIREIASLIKAAEWINIQKENKDRESEEIII